MSKEFTCPNIPQHNSKNDFLVIQGKVYDVTHFADEHPGGRGVIIDFTGQDATEAFNDVSHSDEARDILSRLQVGTVGNSSHRIENTTGVLATVSELTAKKRPSGFKSLLAVAMFGCVSCVWAYMSIQRQQES